MAFKMKGYGGFHGKKKSTLRKTEMESSIYDQYSDEVIPYSSDNPDQTTHAKEGTVPRSIGRDFFDNRLLQGDDWQSNYPQGDQFTPNPDTDRSRGGGTFNLTQEDIEQIKRMDDRNLSSKDRAIKDRLLKATQGSKDKGDFKIEIRPNEFKGVKSKSDGTYSNRWISGQAYVGKEGKEGFSDLSQGGKYKNSDITNFLLNIPSGEFVMKEPFDLETIPVDSEGENLRIPPKKPGLIETKRLPDPKPPKKEQKTGEIPWDDAPKINTDARKKFYDKYNLRYDDTIEGFDRDGSPSQPQPVRRDGGNVKKKRKKDERGKGLNLDLSQINFSDWDRPIREFFGQ